MSAFGSTTGSQGVFGTSNTQAGSSTNANTTQSGIFGNPPAAGGGIFGGATPGATGTSGLFGASSGTGITGNAFGSNGGTGTTGSAFGTTGTTGGLFGNTGTTGVAASTTGGLFGGGNPGTAPNRPGISTPTSTTTSTNVLGGTTSSTTTPASTSTGTAGTKLATTSFFALPKSGEQNSTNPAKPAGSSLFGQPNTTTTTGTTPPTGTTPATSSGLFGQPLKADSTAPATATTAPTPNIFSAGLFGKPTSPAGPATNSASTPSTTANSASTAPAASSSLNFNLGAKPADKDDASAASTPAFNLFGKPTEEKKDASAPAIAISVGQPSSVSTTAVAPPSTLRGKTIEEIVNKWSTDLETHVREFNKFAGEVAVWDRALIDNGNNLSSLYSHVEASEREQNDIDQSLDHIEQQQQDLASTLTAFEKVTQEILGNQGGGLRALDTGPADTERDKNYMLATDLHTHLDDLSGSLTQMIDSVNALSLPSNESGPAEDPMAQIAQILSSHLESLQWIDGAAREVESKVTEVERKMEESGHGYPSTSQKSRGLGLNR